MPDAGNVEPGRLLLARAPPRALPWAMTWNDLLAGNDLAQQEPGPDKTVWPDKSPFHWMARKTNKAKGQAAATMVATVAEKNGYVVTPSGKGGLAQSFSVSAGIVKVKLCMIGPNGSCLFQQIKGEQYDFLAMLGLGQGPSDDADLWICTKEVAFQNASYQHADGNRSVKFKRSAPPKWLASHGGPIADAAKTLAAALGNPP